jgi:hypothetical protein
VFVHHDSNAWISVWLKFESLKNDFEKNLKKEKAFSLSPLLSPQPAQPFSFSPRRFPSRRPLPERALAAHAGPARFPAGPNRASSLFF